MRRSIIFPAILSVGIGLTAACDPKPEVPSKPPAATPTPVTTASPTVAPTASPAKPEGPPDVKKTDDKNVNKDVKPVGTPKAK